MKKPLKIDYCKNSTIREALCIIQGKPEKVEESDAGILEKHAKKHYDSLKIELKNVPTFVMIPQIEGQKLNPFWSRQKQWGQGKYVARFGHRYLSIHRICNEADKYKTYKDSFKPELEKWLEIYKAALTGENETHPVDLIMFGYINDFILPVADFTLDKYLTCSYSLNLNKGIVDAIDRYNLAFDMVNTKEGINCTLKVKVESLPGNDTLKLTTEIYSSYQNMQNFSFYSDNVLEKIEQLKKHAKETFFSFVNQHVRDEILEVVSAKN